MRFIALTSFDSLMFASSCLHSAQQQPVVPQGPYENVFDIAYHSRDSRRRNVREELSVEDSAAKAGLPPTPGNPAQSTFLGLAADFDRQAQ